jgi:hypothetical protein
MNLVEFLRTYPDTDTNFDKNDKLVIEAYNEEGDIIDVYNDCRGDICGYFERKFGKNYEYHGIGLINFEFNGSFDLALEAIKEDL